jgi:RHS repeat-associated protein
MACLKLNIQEQKHTTLKVVYKSLNNKKKSCSSTYPFKSQEQESDLNLIYDHAANIDSIAWTVSGKVKAVYFADNRELRFLYDPNGNRIMKKMLADDGTFTATYYSRDAQGNIMAIYQNTNNEIKLESRTMYAAERLGEQQQLIPNPLQAEAPRMIYTRQLGHKTYQLTDHLGNVRALLSDRKLSDFNGTTLSNFRPEMVGYNNYYPFGMMMPGRNYNAQEYRYGFNGMEKDDEIKGTGNSYDFGARIYDVRLGRWLSIDPLASKYPYASTYNFALNTPIQAVDPDGKVVIFVNGYQGGKAIIKDYFDRTSIVRSIYRVLSTESLTKSDDGYWGNMDDDLMDRIGDHNAVYANASSHALSTASYRYNRGKEAGEVMLKMINDGEIKLQTDEKGKVTETVKIVSHSQGGAYAAGMSKVLTDAGYKVEVEYYFAPKQPGDIPKTSADRRVQYGSDKDMVAPQSPMNGYVEQGGGPSKDGAVDGHMLYNYENVLDVKKGEDGYVAPRKDK